MAPSGARQLPRLPLPWWFWPAAAFLVAYPLLTLAPGFPFGLGPTWPATAAVLKLSIEAGALFWAAARADLPRRLRLALRLGGGTALLAATGSSLYAAWEAGLPIWSEPLDQAAYLLSYLLALATLLAYPRLPLRRGQGLTVVADLLVSVGSLGVLSWLFLTVPAASDGGAAGAWAFVLGVSQLAVLAGLNVLVLLGQAVPSRRAFWWYVAGQASYLTVLLFEQLIRTHPTLDHLNDLAWFTGVIPTMVAAALMRSDPLPAEPRGGSPRRLLDVNPLALASPLVLGAFLLDALGGGPPERVLPLGVTLIAVSLLLVVRIALTARENARLVREELEADRRAQAEKMESVSRLAGGIAHEFNNLMATVVATASMGAREAPPDGTAREDFDTIRQAGQRAAALTRQLQAFAGRPVDTRRPVDVAAQVNGLAPRLREVAGPAVALRVAVEPAPAALADPDQLSTVLSHLTANAAQAMPAGGTLSVTVRAEVLDQPLASPFLAAPPGHYVALAVSDTGPGIAPDVLPRIFDPFFSTRPIFESKGLGLAEVHGIVSAHRGGIAVESAPGRGSTFTVYLPVA
jgi:signal transduction histidine kinase